jgi:conjugal transfer mating pair stabilization protein TraG
LSSLQRSATDTVSTTETYNQTVSAQSRFGASTSFGAAETGRRLASDQNLMSRLDTMLDQFGLRGDTQRLGAQWRASGLMTDKEQAYAAAGMSLLAGYSSPIYRQLDQHETRLAEAAGYQLLGDAWNAPKPDGQSPAKNAGLRGQAHEFGDVRSKAGETAFHDPRNEAGGLGEQVIGRIQKAENRVDDGGGSVNAAYQKGLGVVEGASDNGFDAMHSDKVVHFRDQISKAANSQPSAAEFEYDAVGGAIYNTAQNISMIGASGYGSVKSFIDEFDASRIHGKSLGDSLISAMIAVPEGGMKAAESWADQRVAESGNRLTPTQQAYYRASMFESFAGASVVGDYNPFLGQSSELSERLRKEHGDQLGTEIASLLRRAAGQNRPDIAKLI